MLTSERLPRLLLSVLRVMDAEATNTTQWKGNHYPTGLRYYDKHLQPNLTGGEEAPHCTPEHVWPGRIAELLTDSQRRVTASAVADDRRYPGTRETCDLVVVLPQGERVRIEMKGLWRYDRDTPSRIDSGKSWRKHLLGSGNSVVHDFHKLARLTSSDATHIGVLVLGFDLAGGLEIPSSDIEDAKTRGGFVFGVWQEFYDCWPDEHQERDSRHGKSGFRVRCWFWYRAVSVSPPQPSPEVH